MLGFGAIAAAPISTLSPTAKDYSTSWSSTEVFNPIPTLSRNRAVSEAIAEIEAMNASFVRHRNAVIALNEATVLSGNFYRTRPIVVTVAEVEAFTAAVVGADRKLTHPEGVC